MAIAPATRRSSASLVARVACAGALIVVLGFLAFKAGKEGLSNFYAQSAHLEIERWSAPGQRLRGDEWVQVLQYLAQSLRFSPDSAWPLEQKATLHLRMMRAATDPQLARAAALSANRDFHLALIERPTSPFAWGNLALTKLYLEERDDELVRALLRAEELGPWEPAVQQSVVFVGLALWNELDAAQQAVVFRAMARGAQRNAGAMAEIAKAFKRSELFCAIRNNSSIKGLDVCSRIGKSGKISTQK